MSKIPIFDSLSHPTIDGNWILPKHPNIAGAEVLKSQMIEANVKWTFAVGMYEIGSYSEKEYILHIKKHFDEDVYPIAFYTPNNPDITDVICNLKKIKDLGYYGIKLHPRISNFYPDEHIANIIKIANDFQLLVMLCTYNYGKNSANKIVPETWMELLSKTENSKIILLHSGAVRLMEYMEIARAFPNILLDLSFTFCKYKESSLDMDIKFMFNNFDKRICVGSDFPEFSLPEMRQRFEFFSKDIAPEKAENIAFKNIFDFIKK